jgi:hypothetical protein
LGIVVRRWIAILAVSLSLAGSARAVDLQKLSQETIRTVTANGWTTLVMWMPTEFWSTATETNPNTSPQMRAQLHDLMDEYAIFAIIHGRMTLNGLEATPRDELLRSARLEANGMTIEPLRMTEVKPGIQAMMAAMKPIFASMFGAFGQNLEFVLYPNGQKGKHLVDPSAAGNLKYVLADQTFTWRLPLGSLLPPKRDPHTGEEFPGNYQFNPFTGDRLSAR